ncbi:MAG: hypothetical protein JNM86_05105 [Phycisphaerae bacterium]|nr:hypothetical protein [Phycisphaerae bacterium]
MKRARLVLLASAAFALPALAQDRIIEGGEAGAAAAPPVVARAVFDPTEVSRLQSLSPADPTAYLELGEDILELPDSHERVEMARQLFARALEFGRVRPENRRTAASAAIALASMSKREGDRLWLRSVAAIIEPSNAEFTGAVPSARRDPPVAAARASLFLTQLRAGAGSEARDSLAAKGVRDVLTRHERELSANGGISVQHLENEAKKWPCTECASSGIVVPPRGQRGPAKLCPVCAGQPGMKLSAADLAAQLRLKRRLAGSYSEPWGSLAASEGAPPARDPDPATVASSLGVDARLSVWRDGRWSLPEQSPTPP